MKLRSKLLVAVAVPVAAVAVYRLLIYPRWIRWGATDRELNSVLPGDNLVAHPKMNSTRAILIRRPAKEVFPWLLQIGQSRGGFYSYERLENLAGCRIHNANRIEARWQNLKAGDPIGLHPKIPDAYHVAEIRPDRYLLLRGGPPDQPAAATWLFYLWPVDENNTRLIVRSRGTYEPTTANFIMWRVITEPLHFIMERGMLHGLRDRVESTSAKLPAPSI